MNDGAAVLLSGYKSEIPPLRPVLGFKSAKLAGYGPKPGANTRHGAEQANHRRHRLFFIAPDGHTDRRTGTGARARLCSLMGRLGSEAGPWQPDPRQVHCSRLFLAPFRARQVQEHARQSDCFAQSQPETDEVVIALSQCLNADAPSRFDSCAPVSVPPLTITNQNSWTEKWPSAK